MPNQSGKVVLLLVLGLLLLGAAVYFFLPTFKKQVQEEQVSIPSIQNIPAPQEANSSSGQTKDYYSKTLKINIKLPLDSQVEEKFTDIDISSKKGKVTITRVDTNFPKAKEHFKDLKEKNHLQPRAYEEKLINGKDSVLVTLADPNDRSKDQKTYFVYVDGWVYAFSSSDQALYPVLDQIVQSFEYRP